MGKHRLNNKGFVLIEVIVALVVISISVLINLQISNQAFKTDIYLKEKDILITQLNSAKQYAINSRSNVNIVFDNDTFRVITSKTTSDYKFKSIVFQNSKELYFNAKGNLNQGYTILFKHGYKHYKLTFYLGKGWYKLS